MEEKDDIADPEHGANLILTDEVRARVLLLHIISISIVPSRECFVNSFCDKPGGFNPKASSLSLEGWSC